MRLIPVSHVLVRRPGTAPVLPVDRVTRATSSASPHREHAAGTPASDPMNRPRPRRARESSRRRRRLVVIGEVTALALVLTASAAHAETTQVIALAGSIGTVLDNTRNWIVGILAGLATLFLTVGGVRYVASGGEPGEVEKAKSAFKSAGWGYGLAMLAPVVVDILKSIVGA
jgi:hypothetical protein